MWDLLNTNARNDDAHPTVNLRTSERKERHRNCKTEVNLYAFHSIQELVLLRQHPARMVGKITDFN